MDIIELLLFFADLFLFFLQAVVDIFCFFINCDKRK